MDVMMFGSSSRKVSEQEELTGSLLFVLTTISNQSWSFSMTIRHVSIVQVSTVKCKISISVNRFDRFPWLREEARTCYARMRKKRLF